MEFQFNSTPNASIENVLQGIKKVGHIHLGTNKKTKREVEIDRIGMQEVVEITTTYKSKTSGEHYCIQEYWRKDGKRIGDIGPKIEE